MGKSINSIIDKIESKPYRTDVSLNEITRYLNHFGFERHDERGKGSHCVFRTKEFGDFPPLVIPCHGKTIKAAYVLMSVKAVKEIIEKRGENK